ncbi:MAG: hypothetical protein Q8Q22_02120 [bacterium]|nr:hypothetical protein [bacterium]
MQKTFWDFDILIILKEKVSILPDLSFLQTIVAQFTEYNLDLKLFYANEVDSADLFSIGKKGAFFSKILADATIVYGINPFAKFSPSEELVVISLINGIQRYISQARREYVGLGGRVRDKNPKYHQKHLRRVMYDLMLLVDLCNEIEQVDELFKQHFPGTFSDVQWSLLLSDSDEIVDYIEMYEKVYIIALEISRTLLPKENRRLNRASLQDVAFEYLLPDSYTEAVIVVGGLPRVPELKLFVNLLASWGYATFFPRLVGTWESKGEFLDHNFVEDVNNLAHNLRKGLVLQGKVVKVDRVLVLGSSFGGLVALGSSLHKDVAFSIALSPVYSMSEVKSIETLGPFIKENYGGAYRYSDDNWQKLINNELISLGSIIQEPAFNATKCIVIAGETDEQIDITALNTLCEQHNIAIYKLPVGHLSFHKDILTTRPLLRKLLKGDL